MKIELFKTKKDFKKKDFILDTDLYWKIALCLGAVMILFSLAHSYFLFKEISVGVSVPGPTEGDSSLRLDEKKFNKILEYYRARQKTSLDIIQNPSPIVDPSQ